MNVKKMHWVIHPGYSVDPEKFEFEEEAREWVERYFEMYVENARTLLQNEITILFSHKNRKELRAHAENKTSYWNDLQKMREVLGRRLIVLSYDWSIFECQRKPVLHTLEVMRGITETRGFKTTIDTPTLAYGEYADGCLVSGADTLNRLGNFSQKTTVLTRLTDLNHCDTDERAKFMSKLCQGWDGKGAVIPFENIVIDNG